jgi:hypothetical protein
LMVARNGARCDVWKGPILLWKSVEGNRAR